MKFNITRVWHPANTGKLKKLGFTKVKKIDDDYTEITIGSLKELTDLSDKLGKELIIRKTFIFSDGDPKVPEYTIVIYDDYME